MPDTALPDGDVRAATEALLGRSVRDLAWHADPVDPAQRLHSVTAGVLRVHGTADTTPYSLVVKQTRLGEDADPHAMWVSGADADHRNYWKREYLAYSTGLLGGLPGRLRAPRLLHAHQPTPTSAWLWLEDVVSRGGRHGPDWADGDYAVAGHDLGTTQGAVSAAGGPPTDLPWLSRGWLAAWVQASRRWWPLLEDAGAWGDERVAALAVLRGRVRAVLAEADRLLALTEAAPRTLLHLDLWPTNLFATAAGTVAIDWSSVGTGPLAADLDQVTLDPVWMQVRPGGDLDALERAVLPSYAAGLRAGGLDAGDAEVRRWYAVTAGLRYTTMLANQAEIVADPARVAALEARWSRPFAAIAADRARVVERSVALAEEALHG